MAEKKKTPKIAARDIYPLVAVEAGYNMYLADNCDDSVLRKSGQIAIRQFDRMMGSFPEKSPEGIYCLNLRMAANSLARGIATRKRNLNKRIAAAEQKKDDMINRIAETEKYIGFLRGALHLLVLGGFGYVLVMLIFRIAKANIPALGTESGGEGSRYASVAFALSLALVGSFLKSRIMAKKVLAIFSEYNEAIAGANNQYTQSVIMEYKLAAETANMVWKELTGSDPPMTPGLHNLLISIMGGESAEAEKENNNTPSA
ncbi:MAG: hypothetical protein ACYSYV_10975 [Planctomycetota bacterium]|jgi:hypothetical protein